MKVTNTEMFTRGKAVNKLKERVDNSSTYPRKELY